MLEMTDGYKSAIVGDVRQMFVKAMLELIDPDIVYQTSNGSGSAAWSKPEQLYNKNRESGTLYATLEQGRWILDGTAVLLPDDLTSTSGEVAHVGDVLSDPEGYFHEEVYAELKFANVSILQACSVYFSTDVLDGIPEDFSVVIMSGDAAVYSKEYTGNTQTSVSLVGFTAYDPTAIRVYVTKWSIGQRRMRVTEIIPGLYEEWTDDVLASLDIQMRGNFSCLALPYGECVLRMDNFDRRFEPRNKSGIFQSIEERQGIPIALGVKLEDGTTEYKQVGVFYQANGGWKTSDNDVTMQWNLVDIVGLVASREFIAPSTLPTTLSGWVSAVVAQLGTNFANRWHVDPNYSDASVTVNSVSDVNGKLCGDVLRWACMATGTWPRADAETGYLTAEPFWSQGNKMDLDNMTVYPVMKANDELAALIFKLYDGNESTYVISGNSTSSSRTITVSNPFIHTQAQALTAARQILSQYGGLKLEAVGRGNPASEIGDVDTVQLSESAATTGRRMEQSFTFQNGVLRDCKSVLLQADGGLLYNARTVLTESGTIHIPAGITEVRVILVGGGQGGSIGQDADYEKSGEDGMDGSGGKVWSGTIGVNSDTDVYVEIGTGGKASSVFGTAGEYGTATIWGSYSSDNGAVYSPSYTDVSGGDAYGRSGVGSPKNGTGDGGRKGYGGSRGSGHFEEVFVLGDDGKLKPAGERFFIDAEPGKGSAGANGAGGACVVYWDKEAET